MEWDVTEVIRIKHLQLAVKFADGTQGNVKFEHSHLTGVFAALQDPAIFNQALLDSGAVVWPGDLDLAPDAMYKEIKANGVWILK